MFKLNINISLELGSKPPQLDMDPGMVTSSTWFRLRRLVKTRDNSTCYYCGTHSPNGHIDHIIPVSKGGSDTIDNLVWACQNCNSSKGDKTISQWLDGSKEVTEEEKAKIREMHAASKSLREISQTLWGEGKNGAYYNEKIRNVLENQT